MVLLKIILVIFVFLGLSLLFFAVLDNFVNGAISKRLEGIIDGTTIHCKDKERK